MPAASATSAGGPTMPKPSQAAVDRFTRAERSMGGYHYYEYDGGSQSAADTKPESDLPGSTVGCRHVQS